MDRIDALPLSDCWHEMSWLEKGLMVMKAVEFMAQLYRLGFDGIGSL